MCFDKALAQHGKLASRAVTQIINDSDSLFFYSGYLGLLLCDSGCCVCEADRGLSTAPGYAMLECVSLVRVSGLGWLELDDGV